MLYVVLRVHIETVSLPGRLQEEEKCFSRSRCSVLYLQKLLFRKSLKRGLVDYHRTNPLS